MDTQLPATEVIRGPPTASPEIVLQPGLDFQASKNLTILEDNKIQIIISYHFIQGKVIRELPRGEGWPHQGVSGERESTGTLGAGKSNSGRK